MSYSGLVGPPHRRGWSRSPGVNEPRDADQPTENAGERGGGVAREHAYPITKPVPQLEADGPDHRTTERRWHRRAAPLAGRPVRHFGRGTYLSGGRSERLATATPHNGGTSNGIIGRRGLLRLPDRPRHLRPRREAALLRRTAKRRRARSTGPARGAAPNTGRRRPRSSRHSCPRVWDEPNDRFHLLLVRQPIAPEEALTGQVAS